MDPGEQSVGLCVGEQICINLTCTNVPMIHSSCYNCESCQVRGEYIKALKQGRFYKKCILWVIETEAKT